MPYDALASIANIPLTGLVTNTIFDMLRYWNIVEQMQA